MGGVAPDLYALLTDITGSALPLRVRTWDGAQAGPGDAAATIVFRTPVGARRLLWSPGELGLARAFIAGDLDIEGDLLEVLDLPEVIADLTANRAFGLTPAQRIEALRMGWRHGILGPPPPPPPQEMRRRPGARHTPGRDAHVVSSHYDVGNDFYRIVLGPTMVYSCAFWARPPAAGFTLEDAQTAKLELVCTKLGLRPGMRLLDIGCGWGSLLVHAATHHGVSGVGITLSSEQVSYARQRIADAGLSDQVEVRLQDYRHIADGPFDAISSIGMSEHVGADRLPGYAKALAGLLAPEGRLLNHAIASVRAVPPATLRDRLIGARGTLIDRYVFPDGEVPPVSKVIDALEQAGLEVRDDEALREHYGHTLRAWVANLEADWEEAQRLAGPARARIWRLYMSACALAFEHGGITVQQVLAVRQGTHGRSGMPASRAQWLGLRQERDSVVDLTSGSPPRRQDRDHDHSRRLT
jgi:cyclopropane-fatty-acyl-phospholipid synthase